MFTRKLLVFMMVTAVINDCFCEETRRTNIIRRKKIKRPKPQQEVIEAITIPPVTEDKLVVEPPAEIPKGEEPVEKPNEEKPAEKPKEEEPVEKPKEEPPALPPVSLEVPVLEEVPRPKVQSIIDRLLKKKKKVPLRPQQHPKQEDKIEVNKYIPLLAPGEDQKGESRPVPETSGSVEVLRVPEAMSIEVVVEDTKTPEVVTDNKEGKIKGEKGTGKREKTTEQPVVVEEVHVEESASTPVKSTVEVPAPKGAAKGSGKKGNKKKDGGHKKKEESEQADREKAEQRREELERKKKEEEERKKEEEERQRIREEEEVARNKERIVTETMLFRKGVPTDYSYNETASDPGGVVSVPGCPKSIDGYPWVLYRPSTDEEPKCFLVGHHASVCPGSAVMNYQRGSDHGVCACNFQECLEKRGLPLNLESELAAGNQLRRRNGVPGKLRYRYCKPMGVNCEELVYDQKEKRCDILYTQGPCTSGNWLQRNSKGGVECAPRLCKEGNGLAEKSELFQRSYGNVTEDNAECCKPWGGLAVGSVITSLGRLNCASNQIYSETLKKCVVSFKSSGLIVG